MNLTAGGRKDLRRASLQHSANTDEVKKAYVALSAFDFTHMTSIDVCHIRKRFLGDALNSAAGTNRRANRHKLSLIVIITAKSHARIIKESGKIGHGIYASTQPSLPMHVRTDDQSQLKRDVFNRPPAAALPSNLSDYWLDAALQDAERLVSADSRTDPKFLRLPLSLVLHLLNLHIETEGIGMADEQLFHYIMRYRLELAMEKLRRLGVRLRPPATEATIFAVGHA